MGPGSELGGYRIEREAARGGWSVVYRAVDRGGWPVAIKAIAPELAGDPGYRERFRREFEIARAIDHPHVPAVYAVEPTYAVMQWVEGTELRALAPLDPQRAARVVAQVAWVLDVLHGRGLVHRDVKPGNVLVERRDGVDHAYLTDFGLAKEISADPGLTPEGRWLGTVDFAAPEQIRGQPADPRSDVYSLGCVLGFALTGAVPYPRASPEETMRAHLHESPPLLGPPHARMNEVIVRALAKDPNWRFQSAGELGQAALAAAGVELGPDRRSRMTAAAVVAGALALIVAASAIAWSSGGDEDGGSGSSADVEALDTAVREEPPGLRRLPVSLDHPTLATDDHVGAEVELVGDEGTIYLEDQRLPASKPPAAYEVWLYRSRREVRSLGSFETDRRGRFDATFTLERGWERYPYLDISLERRVEDGRHEGRSVVRGGLAELSGPGP